MGSCVHGCGLPKHNRSLLKGMICILLLLLTVVVQCSNAEAERPPGVTLLERGAEEVQRTNDFESTLALWYSRRTPSVANVLDSTRLQNMVDKIITNVSVGEVWESNSTRLFRYWSLDRKLEKTLDVPLAQGWTNQSHKVSSFADWSVCASVKARYVMVTPELDGTTLQFVRHISGIPSPTVTLFAGCENTATALHYDNARSVFLQLRGRKRFILLSPEDILNAYYAPAAHPYYRQSLLEPADLADPINYNRFPMAALLKGRALIIDLKPGDALVVPKRWSHFAASLSNDSLGLSIRGTIDERAKTASASIPLPFELDWSFESKVAQLERLLVALFPDQQIRLRYLERWRKAAELSRGESCAPVRVEGGSTVVEASVPSAYQEKVPGVVEKVRKSFKLLAETEEVMQVLLMDFMDDVLLTVLEPDSAVNWMLQECEKQSKA